MEVVDARTYFAHDAIVEAAAKRHADLIVMGTHGRRGLSRVLLGSNAERVLRQAPCHVLTVRADAAVPAGLEFRKLLVPVDFSECSRQALDSALALGSEGQRGRRRPACHRTAAADVPRSQGLDPLRGGR